MDTRIYRFLALTFGISWLVAAVIWFVGLPYNGSTANWLISLLYLPAPGIAALLLSSISRQPILPLLHWRHINWRQVAYLPLIFVGFIIASFLVVYLLGNTLQLPNVGSLEWSEGSVKYRLAQFANSQPNYSKPIFLGSLWLFLGGLGSIIAAGFTLNAIKSVAEELGWRGYLYQYISDWGYGKSSLFIGVALGLWLLPLVSLLGVNFPNHPYLGALLTLLGSILSSFLLTAARRRVGSVWGAAILSGMLRGCAMLFFVYIVGGTELYASPVGIAGVGGLLLVVAILALLRYGRIDNSDSTLPNTQQNL